MSAWLHIDEKGAVTVYTGKVEVGQNARTSLTQAVAEELHAPLASITMVMGDTALTPFDQGTFGSQTSPRMWPQIRKASAAAREMLIDLASQKWMVERASVVVANGKVTAGAKAAGFGELTRAKSSVRRFLPRQRSPQPRSGKSWNIGRQGERPRHRHRRPQYTFDMKRPGMLYGKVLYPPQFGARLLSLDVRPPKPCRESK